MRLDQIKLVIRNILLICIKNHVHSEIPYEILLAVEVKPPCLERGTHSSLPSHLKHTMKCPLTAEAHKQLPLYITAMFLP